MKLAVAPTVFIGLGGTGTLILQKLRQRLEHRVGTADLPFLRYLYVDTQKDSALQALQGLEGKRAAWSLANVLSPPDDVVRSIQDPNRDGGQIFRRLQIADWFDEGMRQRLSTVGFSQGVGGRRMFSHLAFVGSGNMQALRQALIAFHQDLATVRSLVGTPLEGIEPSWLVLKPTRVLESIRFVAVASSGGGTGSGCFVDLGFLLRRLRREQHWPAQTVSQVGYVGLASPGVSKDLEVRNTAALLTELDHYQGTAGYPYHYLTDQDGVTVPAERNPPYDRVFLSLPAQQARPLDSNPGGAFTQLQWRIAEHLLTHTVAIYREEVPDEKVKLPGESPVGALAWSADAEANNPSGFFTFGVATREWPAALATRHLFARLAGEEAREITQAEPAAVSKEVAERCRELGIPEESVRRNGTPRSVPDDKLLEELLKPVAGFEPLAQLGNCKARALDERGRLRSGGLVEAMNALKEQFQSRHGQPVANQPGITHAVLRTNCDRLLAKDSDQGLAQVVAGKLLDLCASKGPATAAEATRQLAQAVAEELGAVVQALEGVKPSASQAPKRLEECWEFANASLLQQLLERKKEVYGELRPWLEKLGRRFEHFTRYLEAWQGRLGSMDGLPSSEAPSVVLPKETLERLTSALKAPEGKAMEALKGTTRDRNGVARPGLIAQLRELVRQGLPDQDASARPTLFAEGPPRKEGAADYSHLQVLEQGVFDRITQAPGEANPYNLQILSLLQQESSRTGIPVPNLVEEAEPLVHFHGDAPDYLNLSFGKAGTQWSRIVQADQEGYPDLLKAESQGMGWLANWPGGVQADSVFDALTDCWSPWSVTYAVERSSIKSHLVRGYDLESRQALLFGGADGPDWFPALCDRRIKLPPSAKALDEARNLLVGSILLGRWIFLGPQQGFEFHYERVDPGGRAIPERYRTSADQDTATRDLAHRPEVREALKRNVRTYLRNRDGQAADTLRLAVGAINERRLQAGVGSSTGDLPALQLYGLAYDPTLEAVLAFCSLFEIAQPTVVHEYARFHKAGEALNAPGKDAGQDGWYCQRCDHLFGVSMPGRTLECPVCGLPNR